MNESYLVAYTHSLGNIISSPIRSETESISFTGKQINSTLFMVRNIASLIQGQTGHRDVRVLSITNLSKLARDAEREDITESQPSSKRAEAVV